MPFGDCSCNGSVADVTSSRILAAKFSKFSSGPQRDKFDAFLIYSGEMTLSVSSLCRVSSTGCSQGRRTLAAISAPEPLTLNRLMASAQPVSQSLETSPRRQGWPCRSVRVLSRWVHCRNATTGERHLPVAEQSGCRPRRCRLRKPAQTEPNGRRSSPPPLRWQRPSSSRDEPVCFVTMNKSPEIGSTRSASAS